VIAVEAEPWARDQEAKSLWTSGGTVRSSRFFSSACRLAILAIFLAELSSPRFCFPQERPKTTDTPSVQSNSGTQAEANAAIDSSDKTNSSDQKNKDQEKPAEEGRHGSFVGAPIPTSSPAIGTGATIIAGYIFPISTKDKLSPPSVIGGAVVFTDNGTRAMVVGTELYFDQDRYHVLTGVAKGNLNYDFYGTGNAAGNAGLKFGLNQTGTVFFGEALRRAFWHIFIGPRLWFGSSSLSPQNLQENFPDLPPLNVTFHMRSIGFKVERDTTPNRFYPEKGSWLQFGADFFSKGIGSTFSFQTYRLTFNKYHSFDSRQVLAYNAYLCTTGGSAPFFGECIFGMENELRGYPAGRYIDRKMLATQAEYRLSLPKRLGIVGFAGLGEVGPTFGSFDYSNLLPSIGAGVRFKLSTKYHVNLRADIAQGRDQHTFSMGLGEAF